MGIKGQRPNKKVKREYDEPELVVNVEDIIEKSIREGFVDTNGNIEIEAIAEWNGIEVSYEKMDSSKSGYLKNINNKWIIGVNKLHNRKRQRFTIAHELGHYYMHKNSNLDFEDSTFFRTLNMTSIEYTANDFAAKLLMPETRIKESVDGGIKSLFELAELFNVSAAAIKYRVVSLGYKMKENE